MGDRERVREPGLLSTPAKQRKIEMTQPSTPAFFLQIPKRRSVHHQIFPSANLHQQFQFHSLCVVELCVPRRFLNFQPFSFASWPLVFLSSSSLQSFLQSSSERGNVLGFTMFRKARTGFSEYSTFLPN